MRQYPHKTLGLLIALLAGVGMPGTPALADNTGEAKQQAPNDQRTQLGEFIDDAWITTKIKALLLEEDALSALKIDHDGSVKIRPDCLFLAFTTTENH